MTDARTSKELVAEIRKWLKGEKGSKYACARAIGVSHDEDCAACLLIAVEKLLSSSAHEPLTDIGAGIPPDGAPSMPTAQPPEAAPRKQHRMFDVLVITTAYESGFGHGLAGDDLPNPYSEGEDAHAAYSMGVDAGKFAAQAKARAELTKEAGQ